jgi:ribonuclease R
MFQRNKKRDIGGKKYWKKDTFFHEEKVDLSKVWIYKEAKWDFGFVDIIDASWNKKGYYVHPRNKKDALDGDEVCFSINTFKWKEEALIIKVTKRAKRIIVWKLEVSPKWFGFVTPNNAIIKTDIYVHPKNFLKAKNGDIVGVEIKQWSWKNPEGTIVQVLWKEGQKGIDVFGIALEWGAKIEFPDAVIEEAKKVSQKSIWPRKDLRDLFTFTIDGEDAKDLDDAISLEYIPPTEGKNYRYKLYVHIADVTHYVLEKSHLDTEALARGTSIYLTDRVIPMLPEELSNGVCSLNAHEDKATLTCEMDIDDHGNVVRSSVYESVIKSRHRLTYKIVETIKKNNFLPIDTPIDTAWFEKSNTQKDRIVEWLQIAQKDTTLLEILKHAFTLKQLIEKQRIANGYLEFDFPEAKVEVDETGKILWIRLREKLEANKLIEHCMVCANESVGKLFSKIPFLYRVHPKPDEDDVAKAMKIILNYVTKTSEPQAQLPTTIESAIKLAQGHSFLSKIILRSLTKAIYSEKNEGHFWLGLEYYSHFTSPIRRYPDLQIHRIIKEKLAWNMVQHRIDHYKTILPSVAQQCSQREQLSEDIERKVFDLAKVKYMADKIGEIFEWEISGMIPKWLFVELPNTVEWFIDITSFWKGNMVFLEDILQMKNIHTDEVLRFGDKIRVKLKSVDLKMRRIDFEIL